MTPEDKKHLLDLVEEKLKHLPWYVSEFIDYVYDYSPNTLLTYCRDYECFFNWLVAEGLSTGPTKDVDLYTLEKLQVKDIMNYQRHCKITLKNKQDTVARKLAALKSLFHYLSQIAEDEELYPYLRRNVMAKIKIEKQKESETKKAERIASRILVDEEFNEFREFIAEGYGQKLKEQNATRKYRAYLRNRERDLALISLILGSGLRIAEALSIDLDDIDWKQNKTFVTRKGDSGDVVTFSDLAALDMKEYLKIRKERYKPDDSQKAFFLSSSTGKGGQVNRLTVRAAQKMFEKYAEAYGKSTLSIHKLRHSFATKHYQENKDLALLKRIMNHKNINTTMIYTHVFDQAVKESINKTDH